MVCFEEERSRQLVESSLTVRYDGPEMIKKKLVSSSSCMGGVKYWGF